MINKLIFQLTTGETFKNITNSGGLQVPQKGDQILTITEGRNFTLEVNNVRWCYERSTAYVICWPKAPDSKGV